MKLGMNLQKRAIGMIAGILFFIIVINTSVLTFQSYNKYKQAILSKSSFIGETMRRDLQKVLSLGLSIESLEGVNEKLQELISGNAALGYAMVMDTKGKVSY